MSRRLITDGELRGLWNRAPFSELTVEEDAILTPSARDFLLEHRITLKQGVPTMTVTPIPERAGQKRYVEAATGRELTEKPEDMTHLHGNLLVPKNHPRIAFRGRLDSLMAKVIEVQCAAAGRGDGQVAEQLEEILGCLRSILSAEVKEEPLCEIRLLGLDSAGLRRVSHHVQEEIGIPHPVPSYRMGPTAAALNYLRTQVRETELAAALAFDSPQGCTRRDVVEALNRLSSAVYILLCRYLAQQQK